MNFLRRATHYSSGKRPIALYPLLLLKHSSLYATSTRTATTYSTTKYKYTPTRKSKTQPPSPSPSSSPAAESVVAEEKTKVDWARPSEILYQPKVSNSVNLIGHVQIPVQFKATEDGNFWAGTIIAQRHSSQPNSPHSVWIPVVFEGDLAHIANCHLKEKDYVYISGQLSADQPPVNISQGQANVQVMAHSLFFVEGYSQSMKSTLSKQKELSSTQTPKAKEPNSSESISLYSKKTSNSAHQKKTYQTAGGINGGESWKDLVENPDRWWDNRIKKVSKTSPDFKHKETGKALWLKSAPSWVLSSFPPLKSEQHDAGGMDGDPWKDLVENPTKWWDNRSKKLNAKAPDFKHKETSKALWLSQAPAWALPRLTPSKAIETTCADGDDWRDLVDNPNKWWDNRSGKRNARAPDFKHRETGRGLWLDKVPEWALSSLPPLKA